MFFKRYYVAAILLIGITSCNAFSSTLAQTNSTANTFVDPNSRISFHYPSDWHIASQEYTNQLFRDNFTTNSLSGNSSSDVITSVAVVLPNSSNGDSFIISSVALPSPMSVDKYFENTKNKLISSSLNISNAIPISIANLNGVKYNVTSSNGPLQTQMLFVKDSEAIFIGYITGIKDQSKYIADINSIINSLMFEPNSQGSASHLSNTNESTHVQPALHS